MLATFFDEHPYCTEGDKLLLILWTNWLIVNYCKLFGYKLLLNALNVIIKCKYSLLFFYSLLFIIFCSKCYIISCYILLFSIIICCILFQAFVMLFLAAHCCDLWVTSTWPLTQVNPGIGLNSDFEDLNNNFTVPKAVDPQTTPETVLQSQD